MSARPFCAGIGRTSRPCLSCRRRSCAHFLLVFVCYSTKQAKIRSACAEFFRKSCGSLGPKRAENMLDLFEMRAKFVLICRLRRQCALLLFCYRCQTGHDMTKPRQAEGSTGCLDLPAAGPFWDRSSARSWYRVPNGSGLTDLSAIADLLFSLF